MRQTDPVTGVGRTVAPEGNATLGTVSEAESTVEVPGTGTARAVPFQRRNPHTLGGPREG